MNIQQFEEKYLNLFYIFGVISFLVPLVVYLDTVAPTVSFWDCGEFITCSYIIGVPHPPGAPVYLLIGKLFSLLPIPGDIAFRVNIISVLSSVFTILLLYLTVVHLIKRWWSQQNFWNRFAMYFSACLGAVSFTFTETFWFNAVEAEVYAMSMFLTALVFYLAILWMDSYKDFQSVRFLLFVVFLFGLAVGVHLLNLLVIPSIIILILFTDKDILFNIRLWLIVLLLVFIGISSYLLLYIRSGMDPFIDMNNPENLENLLKYLRREQYGQESMFLTIFDRKAPFWDYQIKKMYLRYFNWNFIGIGTTPGIDRGAEEVLSFRGFYGLPLLLGLIGMVHHFIRDWKRALAILVLFIMTGVAITIYLNQPDPQPRERDYVYVGSFYAFAIWMSMGMQAIFEFVKTLAEKSAKFYKPSLIAAGAIVFMLVPLNMARFNYDSHDRSGNYVAWDHSYNILQNCEKDAILFTNGDNDTFPLWYLQAVEGIRKDVKIVNLSLLNTDWYIMQLKHKLNVPISVSDDIIKNIMPVQWSKKKTVVMSIPKQMIESYISEVDEKIEFGDDNTIELKFDLAPTLSSRYGKFLRVQDWLVLDIIQANAWRYPLYFSVTTPNSNTLNLNKYFRMDGLVHKIIPVENPKINTELLSEMVYNKMKYRGINDPDVYFNKMTKGLIQNYRNAFLQLVSSYFNSGNRDKALEALEKMEDTIPEDSIPLRRKVDVENIAQLYYRLGKPKEFEKRIDRIISTKNLTNEDYYKYAIWFDQINKLKKAKNLSEKAYENEPQNGRYVGILVDIYQKLEEFKKAISVLDQWLTLHPNQKEAVDKKNELLKLIEKSKADSVDSK